LGLLNKASLVALVPVVGLGVLVSSLHLNRQGARARARLAAGNLVIVFGLAALLAGWYFLRNWVLHGDPLGWSFLLEINARREDPLDLDVLAWLFRGVFRSFWLGWIGIAFEEPVYWVLAGLCLAGLAGFTAGLVRRWPALDGAVRWALALLGLHAAITLASLIRWTATVLGTDQGRLVYPMLPTLMLILAGGWAWWIRGRGQRWLSAGLALALLFLAALTPARYIAPVHAPAPRATQEELAAATAPDVRWNGIRLLGYRLEGDRVPPGGKLALHLYWQASEPLDQDLMALIQLVDGEGRFLMYTDGSPTAGRDTSDRWKPGVPLASLHLLPVPDYGQPGEYRLTISLRPFGEQDWLTATRQDGTLVGDHLALPEIIHLTAP
jgi:hypothetical protein